MAPGHGRVPARYASVGDGSTEPPVRDLALGDDHQARRFLVQTVDQASSFRAASVCQPSPAPDQGIYQRSGPVSRSRMDHHSGRFVHYKEVGILKDDPKWNIFTHHFSVIGLRLGLCDADNVLCGGAVRGALMRSIYRDMSICD